MIYILIPNNIETFFEIRVFDTFSAVEQLAKQEARSRANPDWCRIFAYAIGVDEYTPCWLFTITPTCDLKRVPIR